MAWKKFGFENTVTSSSGIGGLQLNKIPVTSDYIVWQLPTDIPIIKGSLVLIVNGAIQTNGKDFKELENGMGFTWISPVPIMPDDDVGCIYAL